MKILKEYQDIVYNVEKYKNRSDVFIHFSTLPKLGINPQSSHNTPLGIYGYPIKEMFNDIENDTIPYAGDRPYLIIFQAVGKILDFSDYTNEMLVADKAKIKTLFKNTFDTVDKENFIKINPIEKEYTDKIRAIVRSDKVIAKFKFLDSFNWARHFLEKRLDDDALAETLEIKTFNDMEQMRNEYEHYRKTFIEENFFDIFFTESELSAKQSNAAGKLWNITRLLAKHIKEKEGRYTAYTASIWTMILRKLGYDGFTDKKGSGLIHENEPTQAVFFGTNGIKLLEIKRNVRKELRQRGLKDKIPTYEYMHSRSAELAIRIHEKTGWELVKNSVLLPSSENQRRFPKIEVFNVGIKLPNHNIYLDCRGLLRTSEFKKLDNYHITKELRDKFYYGSNWIIGEYNPSSGLELYITPTNIKDITEFRNQQNSYTSDLTEEHIEKHANALISIAQKFLSKHP